MTTEERFTRIETNLDKLTGVVATLAETVVAHDNQIEGLIAAGVDQKKAIEALTREWQAYLRTIRPNDDGSCAELARGLLQRALGTSFTTSSRVSARMKLSK